MDINEYIDYLVKWLQKEVQKAKQQGVVVGISGGIDSAVVAALAKKAFPNKYLTVWMPCFSSDLDKQCIEDLINSLKLKSVTVDLSNTFTTMKDSLFNSGLEQSDLALMNIKPRLRMATLYSMAQTHKYLVLGTDNAAEWKLGYFTKYGDGGVDLLPLIHLLKRQVKQAAHALDIPLSIINRAPSAGLFENQLDEKEIGVSYDVIDDYLSDKIIDPIAEARIKYLFKISSHKRKKIPTPLKMTKK